MDGMTSRFKEVLVLMEKNLKYLESLGLASQSLQDYKKVLSHLKLSTPVEVYDILEKKKLKGGGKKDVLSSVPNEDLARMTLNEIRQKISLPSVSRASIERVASVRFGVSKSGLSSLRSRDALLEKIDNILLNEGAHEIISRSAAVEDDETK